jgi:hypothetical protein
VELVDKQIDLALNDRYDPKVNMTAARYLTDRCLGPPTQRTELSGPSGAPLSIAQLMLTLDETAPTPDQA